MTTTEQHIRRIQDKLQLLLKKHALLLKENKGLKEELAAAKAKISQQQKNTDELRQQVSILKISSAENGRMNDADKREFEKRINAYLKEIDKCISLLGD